MATLHDGNYKVVDNVIDLEHTTAEAYITQDTSFKLENIRNGRKCIVAVKNGDSVEHSVTFISAGINPNDAIKTIAPNTYTLYNLTCSADGVFICICSENSSGPFPSGADGDLIIHDTETVTLSPGRIYDYNTVLIETGGTLIIDDVNNEANLTEIYAKNFTIDGQIVGRSLTLLQDVNKQVTNGLGDTINISYQIANGGAGGHGGNFNSPGGVGGSSSKGVGGGGGGGGAYTVAGGAGGTGNGNGSSTSVTSGGIGNYTKADGIAGSNYGNGGNGGGSGGGGAGYSTYDTSKRGGGGAGAGYVGNCGCAVFLYCKNAITGNGIIDLSGKNGFNGARGGNGNYYSGGGGSGGGAGGSGGNLIIKAPYFTVAYNIAGGTGGTGGGGGSPGGYGGAGYSGSSGEDGHNGTYTEL